jgi:hypothetical protein
MNFQWTLDGSPVPGATDSLLTLGSLQPANDFGGTVSSNAVLNPTICNQAGEEGTEA